MDITITIGGEDKTSLIEWPSFTIEGNADQQPDLSNFIIKTHSGQTYKPEVNAEVIMTDGATRIFGGRIIQIQNNYSDDIIYYEIECKDYTTELDRIQVIDAFDDMTVFEIIEYINDNYLTGITIANVDCNIPIKRIVFNRKSVTECLNDLSKLTNFIWYIDYYKDIHFFIKNTEIAPFAIEADSDKLIGDSLRLINDLSQLRNVVTVRGADKVATNTRTKEHTGDGIKTTFNTDYKFAELPVVEVNSVPQTVGLENINTTGFDCYWDFNQKYIRFDAGVTDTHAIEITGNPLIPIIVEVEDLGSIASFGRFEFSRVNKSLSSSEDAQLFAQAQLDSYGQSVREGGFRTYESGLSGGQTITINLPDVGVNDSFIIQRITLTMQNSTTGEWIVELATTRTMGIIKFLQDALLTNNNIELNEDEVLEKYYRDNQLITVTEEIELTDKKQDFQDVEVEEDIVKDPFGAGVAPDFVLAPYTPSGNSDPKREFTLDKGSVLG